MSKSPEELEFERQKHRDDIELRRREIELRELQERRSGLHNPLVLAILAAVAGLITNAVVAWLNGRAQNELEDKRAQAAQIIEAIKTGDPDVTAENLRLFVETGLIRDRASQITAYRGTGMGTKQRNELSRRC